MEEIIKNMVWISTEEIIKNMVWISTEEYRELIEAKCKAEADADRNLNDWACEKRRADLAESELEELKAKFEELKAKYEEEKRINGAV